MNLRHRLVLSLLAGLSALPLPAAAVTYCVSDASALQAAITSAASAIGDSVHDIRLRPGTYALPSGLEFAPTNDLLDNKDFSITGGWNAGCSARTINPAATVLDGAAASLDGNFHFGGNQERIVVEGLRFINFTQFKVDDEQCFGSPATCPDTTSVRVRYNEFRNGRRVRFEIFEAPVFNLSNNLFASITAQGQDYPVYLRSDVTSDPPVIAFNTFADLSCQTPTAVWIDVSAGSTTVHHNIVESSCTNDLFLPGQPVLLRNNLYATLSGVAPAASSGNVISNAPGFVNAAAGDFHLRDTAPVSAGVNAGMTQAQATGFGLSLSIPGQDLDGPSGGRLIGANYDLGAYESALDNGAGTTLTVVNSNDSGAGSLRQAILSANASPGAQTVQFNIAGSCPRIILLDTPLPDVVDDLVIDGYTQPGAAPNTAANGSDAQLCIVVGASAAAGTLAQALQVPNAASSGTSLGVKGIAFAGSTGFNGNFTVALRLRGGSNHLVQGNAFSGTGPGNVGSLGTMGFGIQIRDSAQDVLIGGSEPEHRNSFGSMSSTAIVLNDASSGGHIIQNNYIGLSASGQAASSIGLNGIFASASPDVQILDNVIAAVTSSAAISITGASASGYSIQRNRLGVNAFGVPTAALRNGIGIQINAGSGGHRIGSLLGLAPSNLITNSDEAGIWITTTAGTGTLIRPNQIFDNGVSGLGLGVDIGPLGQSTNDPKDPDGGANNGQNHPEITASLPNANGSRQVSVSLDSNPNTAFRIDVYRSPDCPAGNRGGNMLNRVGTAQATTNANGIASASFEVNGGGAPGILVAQATNIATGDSSEPGLCFIEPVATTTTITSDTPDPSPFGQPYTVTAIVTAASGTPNGTLTFSDGQGSQCSDDTLSGGIGSCQLLSTSLGNKTLTASYSGSIIHAPSSDTEAHSVVQASTISTIVSDAPDPSQVGEPYTVSVQVRTPAGNLAIPGGQVSVSDGTGQTCQIAALANGDGSCQLTSVSVGNKTLSASYAGAVNFAASSDTEAHTVIAAATTTTITSDAPDPSLPGQAYTVSVSVSTIPGAGTPSGAVAVNDGAGASCNITLAGGNGSCQLASAAVGAKTLTATYTPSSQAFAASSDTETHTVALGVTTTTITSDAPDPSSVGEPYLVQVSVTSAAGTPTGAVAVGDGSGASCNANLSNGIALCQLVSTTGGAKTLTANYAGDANFAASSDTEAHQVAPIQTITTITSDQPDPSPAGSAYTVAVTVSATSGIVGGTVNVTDGTGGACQVTLSQGGGSCQLISASAGQKTLVANYSGNASYNPSSDTEAHTVSPVQAAATVTTITADTPEPTVPGQPYTVSVTVTSQGGTPGGTVNVNDGAGAGAGICQVTLENGSGSCQLTSQFAGGRLLTACFVATPAFSGSCDNEVHDTIKADTDLSFNGFAPNPPVEDTPTQVSIALGVTAPGSGTPTGTVTVSASATESCVINLPATSCPLTMTTPGLRTITLSYSGDTNFNPSNRQTQQNVVIDSLLANGFE